MAKKYGKYLLGAAVIGAAVAGGIVYFNKCRHKDDTWEDDFEDFEDDYEDDLEEESEETPVSREYVTIPKENHSEEPPKADAVKDEAKESTGEAKDKKTSKA